MLRRFHSLR